jgi:hypothetical protein
MAAKDLMFKIAIFDDTKKDLENIKKNLSELENYALGVSRGVSAAVRSIRELGNGFKLNVPDLSAFAEQIGKIDKALGKKDAFNIKDLDESLRTIKSLAQQLGEVPIKRSKFADTINDMSLQVERGAKKMSSATTSSLETYRDQLKVAAKDIETNLSAVRNRIREAFDGNGNLLSKGAVDMRKLFGFDSAVSERAVAEFVRNFEASLSRVQEKVKGYDKAIVNNQYLVGDIGKIKADLNELETAITSLRNGLSSKGILGNMPENTNKQIDELGKIFGKLDTLEQKLRTFGNGSYPDVMKGFVTAVDNAVRQVSERLQVLNGAHVPAATQKTAAQPKQLELDFKADDLLEPLDKVRERIRIIIEQIKNDVSGGLKDALGTDLSATKTVQSLNELASGLSGLEGTLSKVKTVSESARQAAEAMQSIKGSISSAAGGGIVNTGAGLKTAGEEGSVSGATVVRNINLITNAILQLNRAYTMAADSRAKIAKAGGDTTEVDKYLRRVEGYMQLLGKLRTQTDIIGQKGMMLTDPDAPQRFANAISTTTTNAKELLDVINSLGNATPKGEIYQKLMASAGMFRLDARELTTQASLRETTASNLDRRNILAMGAKDIIDRTDLDNIFGRLSSMSRQGFDSLVNMTGVEKSIRLISEYRDKIMNLSEAQLNEKGRIAALQAEYNKLTTIYRKHLSQLNSLASAKDRANEKGMKLDTSSFDLAERKIASLTFALREYDSTKEAASKLNLVGQQKTDLEDMILVVNHLIAALGELRALESNVLAGKAAVSNEGLSAQQILAKYNVGATETWAKNYNREFKKEIKASSGSVTDLKAEALKAYSAVNNQIQRMDRAMRDGLKFHVDTSALERAMGVMRQYQEQLRKIAEAGGNLNGMTAKSVTSEAAFMAAKSNAVVETQAVQANVSAKKEAEAQNKMASASENEFARSLIASTEAARNQSQVISDLKSMAAQYLSVWGAQQFISDLANITGELELQERSLEVILGNASTAREMYSQIRDLSQLSPYTFEDLLKSHRQLAAFGIETKDMYNTLKSLSDIGAGLDIPVERLILAYGHTKSYGYLSGIQNRQFETAGIDMVGSLTDLYNKRASEEKKLGIPADYVSRTDIFKKMRERSIPFSDVESVIMDLDKPGGKFYNMQLKQYDTLGGKLRNLRNNYRIMMSEIGQDNHGLLTGGVDVLNELMAHWQKYGRILKGIAWGYGAMKLAALAAGRTVVATNRKVLASLATSRANNISTAFLNKSGTVAASAGVMASGDFRSLKYSKDINTLTKQRIALTGRLSSAQRAELLVESGVTKARAAQIAQYGALRRGLMSLRIGLIQAGQAFKAFAISTLTNPMTWVFAAVGIFTAIKDKIDESSEAAKSFADNLKDSANTDLEGLRQTLDDYKDLIDLADKYKNDRDIKNSSDYDDYSDAGKKTADENYDRSRSALQAEVEARGVGEVYEDLRKKLESQSPFYDGDYFDVMRANDELDQIVNMFDKYKSIMHVKQVETKRTDDWKSREENSNGEGYITNAQDYDKARRNFVSAMERSGVDYWGALTESEKKNISDYANAVGESMKDAASRTRATAEWFVQNGSFDRLKQLTENTDNYGNIKALFKKVKAGDWYYDSSAEDLRKSSVELAQGFVSDLKNDFQNDADGFGTYVTDILNKQFSEAKVADPATIANMSDDFFNELDLQMIRGGVSFQQQKDVWTNIASKLVGGNVAKSLEGQVDENMSQEQIDAKVKQAVNQAIRSFNQQYPKLARVLRSLGIDLSKTVEEGAKNIAKKMLPTMYWQRHAIAMHIQVNPEMDTDYTKFINGQRKALKTAEDILNANKKKLAYTLGVSVMPDFEFKAPKNAREYLDKLSKKATELEREKLVRQAAGKSTADIDGTLEFLTGMIAQINKIVTIMEYLDSEHQSYSEDKGGKDEDRAAKAAAQRERQKEAAQRKQEAARRKLEAANNQYDRNLIKRYSDKLEALKAARKMYEDWYNRYSDKEFAIAQARIRMMEAMKKGEYLKGSINASDFALLQNETDMKALLKKSEDLLAAEKMKTSNGKDEKNSLLARYAEEGNTLDINIADKAIKDFSDAAKRELDITQKQYEVYKNVYDKSKDSSFADELSGFRYNKFDSKALGIKGYSGWNQQTTGLTDLLFKKLSDMSNSVGSTVNPFSQQELSTLFGLTGDKLKAKVSEYLGDDIAIPDRGKNETIDAYDKRIKPLLEQRKLRLNYVESITQIIQAWVSALETWNKNAKDSIAEFEGTNRNFKARRMSINTEYDNLSKSLYARDVDGNDVFTAEERTKELARLKANRDYKLLDYDFDAQQLLKSPTTMSSTRARETGKRMMETYMQAFEKGIIDAATYNTKSKAVLSSMSKNIQSGSYGNLLNRMGGWRGFFFNADNEQNRNELSEYRENIAQRLQQEKEDAAIGFGDNNLKDVLTSLLSSIDAVMQGNGGTSAIRNISKYGKEVEMWNAVDKNGKPIMTDKAKAKAANEAHLNDYTNLLNGDNGKRGWFKAGEDKIRKPMDDFIKGLTKANAAISLFSNTLDALGLGDTAVGQAASDATDVMGGMLSGASSLSALGPYGMAAGAALGLLGGLAGVHDKHQQKKIDQLQEDVSAIEGYTEIIAKAQERTLGYDFGYVIRSYQKQYNDTNKKTNPEGVAGAAMAKYYASAGASTDINGYQQQLNMLVQKRKDYVDMYNAESGKKKTSKSALQEYKDKIADLDDQIRYFGQDLAKNLWDVDIKSWADQIGDALMSAFENGENAAKAFNDSVRSILQGVFSKMLKLQVLEPMFQRLQDKLFGNKDNGTNGVFDPNDIVGSSQKVAQVITEFFGVNGEGRNTITAAQEFYNGVNLGLSNAGLSLDNESNSTLSSGISSASEDSVNVLSGYVASMRQDVAVIRLQDSMFYNETLPDYIKTVTSGVSSLQKIDTNVQAIRMLISENGSLYEQVRTLRDDLHSIVTQQKSVKMA